MSNQRLSYETEQRLITCIVCECQPWLYRHVAHYSEVDHTHRVVSVRESLVEEAKVMPTKHVL